MIARTLRVRGLALAALAALAAAIVVASLGPPEPIDILKGGLAPSSDHWLGQDPLGRDLLRMVLAAAPLSLGLTIGATAISAGLGVGVGLLAALSPSRVTTLVESAIELSLTLPSMLVALLIVGLTGPGGAGAMVAVGIATAPGFARTSQVLARRVGRSDYVEAARLLGVGPARLLFSYLLPNIAEPMWVKTASSAAGALISISGLSFLGFGVQPPQADWGRMLSLGLRVLYVTPLPAFAPGAAITLAGFALNALGDMASRRAAGSPGERRRALARRPRVASLSSEGVNSLSKSPDELLEVEGLSAEVWTEGGVRPILREISFCMHPGEALGLVGESGSGKTTLALAIAGLTGPAVAVSARSLCFEGAELLRMRARAKAALLGSRMGVVFQSALEAFNPRLPLGVQLCERLIRHAGLSERAASQQAVDQLRALGVGAPELRMRQRPRALSGGLLQRCLIAMALLPRPSLLIADEPTTALDVTVQAQVLLQLMRVRDRRETAILLVSHDLRVVTRLCTQVAVMYAGRVVEIGPAALLAERTAVHPYTRLLLESLPGVQPATRRADPDRMEAPERGCAFAPRCPTAMDVCLALTPSLKRLNAPASANWRVACWAAEEADTRELA